MFLSLEKMIRFIRTYLLEMLLVWGAYGLYYLLPFAEIDYSDEQGWYLKSEFSQQVLLYLTIAYSGVALFLIYFKQRKGEQTKLEKLIGTLKTKEITKETRTILAFFAVKFFFIPLMVPSTILYFEISRKILMKTDVEYLGFIHYFNNYIYSFIVYAVMTVALAVYSFGYLIESKKFGSKVRSIEPTWYGWVVALICYAPFFIIVTRVIPMYTNEFSFFLNAKVTFVIRLLLILIMFGKLWAIFSLGSKCSNLTNRGIVTSGLYRWIRHPHYTAKLLVWWLNFAPLIKEHYWMIGGMIFWTSMYILRAKTEEDHLSMEPEYQEYLKKVKWRFIPYVF